MAESDGVTSLRLFGSFAIHLRQLRFALLVKLSDGDDGQADKMRLAIVDPDQIHINERRLKLNGIKLDPLTLSQLRCSSGTMSNDGHAFGQISFCIDADMSESPMERSSDSVHYTNSSALSSRMDMLSMNTDDETDVERNSLPAVPSLNGIKLRENVEILNDWIYCHDHDGHQPDAIVMPASNSNGLPLIENLNEMKLLLTKQNVGSKLLFESGNTQLNGLLVEVINNSAVICAEDVGEANSDDVPVCFKSAIHVQYKLLDTAEETQRIRLSFQVDCFIVNEDLYRQFAHHLLTSTRQLIPLETRFSDSFAQGFITV